MESSSRVLLVTLAGDIHLKSNRTKRRFHRIIRSNIAASLGHRAPTAVLTPSPTGRMLVTADDPADLDAAAQALSRVFGVYRVTPATKMTVTDLDGLVDAVTAFGRDAVRDRTFAVRVRRRGTHTWSSHDAEVEIGNRLIGLSSGVDLSNPDVTVRAEVYDQNAYLLEDPVPGADGLPLGTQPALLSLLSGGFDSPVAAWMMMRRGCPVDYVHFTMDCAQSEHALAVGYDLWRTWGTGTTARAWVVDFSEIKEALFEHVADKHRQIALKQLMFRVAEQVAKRNGFPALVTGEAVGQVSTQTLTNLVEIDRSHSMTVFRPLTGFTKEEIITWSRRIGTHDLSARAKEVCNLAVGPVETAVRAGQLARATESLPDDLVARALRFQTVADLSWWEPGMELAPVLPTAPHGAVEVTAGSTLSAAELPRGEIIAVSGPAAVTEATRLRTLGHLTVVVDPGACDDRDDIDRAVSAVSGAGRSGS